MTPARRHLGLDAAYPRIYRALKTAGHDATKAIEILLDARRGNRFALNWVRIIRSHSWGRS